MERKARDEEGEQEDEKERKEEWRKEIGRNEKCEGEAEVEGGEKRRVPGGFAYFFSSI